MSKIPCWILLEGKEYDWHVPFYMPTRYAPEWRVRGLPYQCHVPPLRPAYARGRVLMDGWNLFPIRHQYVWEVTCMDNNGDIFTYAGNSWLSKEEANDLITDGIELGLLVNSVPLWAAELGLVKPWCFLQDLFNFRNPFSGREAKK